MIGRGLVALVWAAGDIGQVALARAGGVGDRAGDGPLVVFAGSSVVACVLLSGLVVVNIVAAGALTNRPRLTRLATPARVIAWLCALRLPIGIGLMVATRGADGAVNKVPQLTFATMAFLASIDGLITLAIAGWTVAGLKRAVSAAPVPPVWH
ncbi:MAG: hypothetical protein DLM58_13450 [Pseudonocardiales bacterium]|nr:MAG: hypothetical protein DLM58_13450 [Pseudonocardiales bacterium]